MTPGPAAAPLPPVEAEAGGGSRWSQLGAFAVLVVLTRLPGLATTRSFNADENTLGIGGRELARGGSLYVGVIDRKPPLPFLAYRAVATADLRLARLVVAGLVLAAAVLVAAEARRRWGHRAGWTAGLVLVLGASALGPSDAQAANFELFALLPIVVAVVAAARGRAATAGVALAFAVLCKQPAAATIVPVAWLWWRTRRWVGVASGLAAGAIAGVVLAAPFGIGRVVSWALLGTGGYLQLAAADVGVALVRLLALVALALGFWGGAWLLASARPAGEAPAGEAPAGEAPAGEAPARATSGGAVERFAPDLDLWLLLGASAVGVMAGFRFFPHYLIALLPALALLAGRGVTRRPAWARPALAWGVVAVVVAGAMAWSVAVTDPPRYETALARYARSHTDPGEEILVWGNEPEIYWSADRQPAGGFTHTEFVTGYSGGRRHHRGTEATVPDRELYRTWIARLRANPPALVIDVASARVRGGEWYPIRGYPALVGLLAARYEQVATIERAPVYRRVDQDRAP